MAAAMGGAIAAAAVIITDGVEALATTSAGDTTGKSDPRIQRAAGSRPLSYPYHSYPQTKLDPWASSRCSEP